MALSLGVFPNSGHEDMPFLVPIVPLLLIIPLELPAEPEWKELARWHGASVRDKEFVKFAERYGLRSRYENEPCDVYRTKGNSIYLNVLKGKIKRVTIRVAWSFEENDEFRSFRGQLPLGLTRKNRYRNVIEKLGQPTYNTFTMGARGFVYYKKTDYTIRFLKSGAISVIRIGRLD